VLKKQISYTDYDDNPRNETFWFSWSKAELAEMDLSTEGGLAAKLERIVEVMDRPKLIEFFKDMILTTVGEKSPDGRQFVKSKEFSKAFSQTEAYSILFMELIEDEEAGMAFIRGVLPKDVVLKVTPKQ
jgi:hypothetical protein